MHTEKSHEEYVFVNRRHTAKTLLMLLIWYFGAAFCGVAVFVLFGVAYKAVTGQYMADFHVFFPLKSTDGLRPEGGRLLLRERDPGIDHALSRFEFPAAHL
jgi:hypothetical protein